MMKVRSLIIVALLSPLLFGGCVAEGGDCWLEVDYDYNRSIGIVVKNAEGDDLFDPNVEGNLLANEITVEYEDEIYPLSEDTGLYHFSEGPYLAVGPYKHGDEMNVLRFGSFRNDDADRQFTIDWGDGTSSEVSFSYTVSYETAKHDGCKYSKAIWHYKIWIDGESMSDDSLIAEIIK